MFYKVVLHGSVSGQDVDNILYYRTGVGVDVSGLTLGGAEELATQVRSEIWNEPMYNAMSTAYELVSIIVYPINEDFQLVYSSPFELPVNEVGSLSGPIMTPMSCINIKFNLERVLVGDDLLAPTRGYVAVGPVREQDIDDAGRIVGSLFNNPENYFKVLADALSANLENALPPVIWFPVRVRIQRNPISGNALWTGYADISSAAVQPVMSFRRSRRVES